MESVYLGAADFGEGRINREGFLFAKKGEDPRNAPGYNKSRELCDINFGAIRGAVAAAAALGYS